MIGKNRLLILGGTSSFAGKIIDRAKECKYEIFSTVRAQVFEKSIEGSNIIYLDLESLDSIEYFIERIRNYNFSHVICLIGSLSNKSSNSMYLEYKNM